MMGATIPAVIAAILLPPLGVFLRFGLGQWFWIAVALTLIGWLPGVIFALVLLFRASPEPVAPREVSVTS